MALSRDVLRIVDANLNRAREGLRVLEDVARFGRDREDLFRRAKGLRHRLAAIEAAFGLEAGRLADARDSAGDPGRADPTASYAAMGELATANARRLEEALRVVEECGRLAGKGSAEAANARFEAYDLEKALVPGLDLRLRVGTARLSFVLDADGSVPDPLATVRAALRGGADVVRLQDFRGPDRDFAALARRLREAAEEAGALFVVRGRADVAEAGAAHGVHLGPGDLSSPDARRAVGWSRLVGLSFRAGHGVEEAPGVDYVEVGDVFPDPKEPGGPVLGVGTAAALIAASPVPAFAAGGVTPATAPLLAEAGVRRAAMRTREAAGTDLEASVRAVRRILDRAAPPEVSL
jgi:thiamine-phosphate pyrophosphorylase